MRAAFGRGFLWFNADCHQIPPFGGDLSGIPLRWLGAGGVEQKNSPGQRPAPDYFLLLSRALRQIHGE
jgi:hypothetical protein